MREDTVFPMPGIFWWAGGKSAPQPGPPESICTEHARNMGGITAKL